MWTWIRSHWQFCSFGLLLIALLLVFNLKQDELPDSVKRDPNAIQLHFDHWLPKITGKWVAAVTIGHHVYFRDSQAQMNPCRSIIARNLLRHELEHVTQYENRGMIDYILGYYGNSFGKLIRYWNWNKAYSENDLERAARASERLPFTPRQRQAILRYWNGCTPI